MAFLALSAIGFCLVFVFFLIVVRTLGSIINHLTKIEYWISQELEFRVEQMEIRHALEMEEQTESQKKQEGENQRSKLTDIPSPGKK